MTQRLHNDDDNDDDDIGGGGGDNDDDYDNNSGKTSGYLEKTFSYFDKLNIWLINVSTISTN